MSRLVLNLGQTDNRSIVLQTRAGIDVDNWQGWEAAPQLYLAEGKKQWSSINKIKLDKDVLIYRDGPTPMFNCHGLTFASRRTNIPDPADVLRILNEDGYKVVVESDILPGDVILYFKEGDVEHSGVVVGKTTHGKPVIVSKWGQLVEAVHSRDLCPYEPDRIAYYRIVYESKAPIANREPVCETLPSSEHGGLHLP